MRRSTVAIAIVVAAGLCWRMVEPVQAGEGAVPLVVEFTMEPDAADAQKLVDTGPLGYHGTIENARVVDGYRGKGLRFDGVGAMAAAGGDYIQKIAHAVSICLWVKAERFPAANSIYIISKGSNAGYQIGLGGNQLVFIHGFWGGGWYGSGWSGKMELNDWTHLALTMRKGDKARIYRNGIEVASCDTPFAFWPVADPLKLGGYDWKGVIDEVRVYAAQLAADQVKADMEGKPLATRAPVAADFPPLLYPVKAALARFDMPIGFRPYDIRQKQTAKRVPGPDAIDWPELTLDDTVPLFREGPEQVVEVPLCGFEDGRNRPIFRQPYDHVVEPTGHWFRALAWIWNQYYVYSTDRTARTASGEFELWTFPVKISGEGQADVKQVGLSLEGKQICTRDEPLHSLTLLLPANLKGKPYELSVNGRGPVTFNVGLQPVEPGNPRDVPIPVSLVLPGDGPKITIASLERPDVFPNQKEWDADQKAMADPRVPLPQAPLDRASTSIKRHLGIDVPRSPLTINTISMICGMSGGHYFSSEHVQLPADGPRKYADLVAEIGFDRDFEVVGELRDIDNDARYEQWFAALAERGVLGGLNVQLQGNPNAAFYSWNIPEFHAPGYRALQLLVQRFGRHPNFTGFVMGADNAGYVPFWDWAPPIPNRPWGRSFIQFQEGRRVEVPVGPALDVAKDYERRGTQKEFVDYIARYDVTFGQYGYFWRGVREIMPGLMFTTGSYGSSPGVGGRGGWPWASIPGRPMHRDLPVQMAYDWNEVPSSKPMHNVALVDRLRSYYPEKPTWTLVDDFGYLFGREARQRAYALALTRGVQAVGTNFMPQPGDTRVFRPEIIAEQKELFAWIHKFGGAYAGAEPLATIGILYVHEQAISRMIVGGEDPPAEKLYAGSHEGKVTEALWLCHAAGWPAKVITPEELQRGLRPSIKAILLVGLNKFDDTWIWHAGLEGKLREFVRRGGMVLLDDESVCRATAVNTGMKVAAYVPQGTADWSPALLARNIENITVLRAALKDVPRPIATSDDPTIWAVPVQCGDVQYLTVVNWGCEPGKNGSRFVKPQAGTLAWNTDRPIYDLRLGRKLTAEDAGRCDLTKDAFRLYALPPSEVKKPKITAERGAGGFYEATVAAGKAAGIPVEITVAKDGDAATVYGATGLPVTLPLADDDPPGTYTVTATELASGLSAAATVKIAGKKAPPEADAVRPVRFFSEAAVKQFAKRKAPLVVALTPEQAADGKIKALADRLTEFYRRAGRRVEAGRVEPNGVVLSLQPLKSSQRYPQWLAVEADLVLLGSPSNNILLLDQARGYLLPDNAAAGTATVSYAWSPFVGEFDAINIVSGDAGGLAAGVQAMMAGK